MKKKENGKISNKQTQNQKLTKNREKTLRKDKKKMN